jgi:ABC-type molybdate transport system substrate-binding protein
MVEHRLHRAQDTTGKSEEKVLMRKLGTMVSVVATLLSLAGTADAADIRVLGVGAVEVAIHALATEFAKDTGHRVIFTIAAPAAVMQKIAANEVHDVVIVAEPAMDELDKDGLVNPESRVRLASEPADADGRTSAGPVSAPPQLATIYEGALMSDGSVPQEARAFIQFLVGPDARATWLAAKLEPLPDH